VISTKTLHEKFSFFNTCNIRRFLSKKLTKNFAGGNGNLIPFVRRDPSWIIFTFYRLISFFRRSPFWNIFHFRKSYLFCQKRSDLKYFHFRNSYLFYQERSFLNYFHFLKSYIFSGEIMPELLLICFFRRNHFMSVFTCQETPFLNNQLIDFLVFGDPSRI